MPKYTIFWTEEIYYRTEIEADSKDAALTEFYESGMSYDSHQTGREFQDSVVVKEEGEDE